MTTTNNRLIRGAKGGDEQRTPTEAADSLRSKQIAQLTDILSEGEIVGLRNGLRSVYLNETPLQNLDQTFNFKDVSVQFRPGTSDQPPFAGVHAAEFEVAVGTEVTAISAVTRTLTTENVNAVRVTLGFPQLTNQDTKTGDITGATVQFKIQIQTNGGGFVDALTDTVSGKQSSRYQKAYKIDLSGDGPWDIRVVRLTADSVSSSLADKLVFDSYTGLIAAQLSHPNTAMVHLRVDAKNFSSIPNRAFHIRGIIVRVPTNYDPETREYTGIWDGTFKPAWSDNPAWCFYDLLTQNRYGLGDFIEPDAIDKWSLYTIGKYCDELVSDGRGGMEPRFTCNLYLQAREDAYKVMQNMASIFRGITFWGGGAIVGMQDSPADPIAQFANANVIDGEFTYSGSSLKQRHTVALVGWNDPKDFYRQKIEYVQDDDDVLKYGIIETELVAFGCSSQGQAHRLGRWILATERFATETVNFKSGLEGCAVFPGAVFQTSDTLRAGVRVSGRIASVTTAGTHKITVDAPITFTTGHTYSLSVILPSGILESRAIYTAPNGGVDAELITIESFSETPESGAVWILVDEATLVPELWRAVGVAESEGGVIDITALRYEPGLYDNVENGIALSERPTSNIATRPPMPTNLSVLISHYRVDNQFSGLRALFSWSSNVGKYRASWREANGLWQSRDCLENSVEIESVNPVIYEFKVVAVSSIGRESAVASITYDVLLGAGNALTVLPLPTSFVTEVPYEGSVCRVKWAAVPGALSYELEVGRNAEPFVAFRTVKVGNVLRYAYSADDMRVDGGPYRNLRFRLRAKGMYDKISPQAVLNVSNEQIGALQGISVKSGVKSVFFRCTLPTSADFDGIMVWMSEDPNFTPSYDSLIYDGRGTHGTANSFVSGEPFEQKTTYYVKAAGYDTLGRDGLTYSSSVEVEVIGVIPDADSIIASMIKDGALTLTKFASGIETVGLVGSLPVLPGVPPYAGPNFVALTTEGGRLYRREGNTWVPNSAFVDPGSLNESHLADILRGRIDKIDGPEATPGTVANKVATEVSKEAALRNSDVRYLGAMAATAIAGAKFATKAQSTATQANVVRNDAIVARVGLERSAAIYEESQVRVTALEAMAQTISGLSATWNQDINASITDYSNVVASEFSAQAQTIALLGVEFNGLTTAVSETITVLNGVSARVELKIDNNGTISGYALDSTLDRNGTPTSNFIIAVDTFQIRGTSTAAATPFEVSTRAGIDVVTIAGTRITNGTITAAALAADSIIAGKIAAGAITAREIVAGAITTDAIVIGTNGGIPGTLIQNGTIKSINIEAGAITAGMITAGTMSADRINGGTITGSEINLASGNFRVIASTGATTSSDFLGNNSVFVNAANPTEPSINILGSSFSAVPAASVVNSGSGGSAHGVSSSGAAAAYDFYASGPGTNYGPFTGAHDVLWPNANDSAVHLGDILVDATLAVRRGLSNTLFSVEPSSTPMQKTAIGVLSVRCGALSGHMRAAFVTRRETYQDLAGKPYVIEEIDPLYYDISSDYQLGAVNALGEGQINVCGENGDIEAGDFIVTSSIAGKGMRQSDDILRNYTVARARESVTFSSPTEIKMIACIYVCG